MCGSIFNRPGFKIHFIIYILNKLFDYDSRRICVYILQSLKADEVFFCTVFVNSLPSMICLTVLLISNRPVGRVTRVDMEIILSLKQLKL